MKTYSRKSSSYLKKAFIASNFNEMCRLCLSEVDMVLTPIIQDSQMFYQEWIHYSVDVLVEEGDGLPPNICEECLGMVEQTYLFKKKCKASDAKLREHLQLMDISECKLIDAHFDGTNNKCSESSEKEVQASQSTPEPDTVDPGGAEIPHENGSSEKKAVQLKDDHVNIKNHESIPKGSKEKNAVKPINEENIIINEVKRYVWKNDSTGEEDVTVCEVVHYDILNEEEDSNDKDENIENSLVGRIVRTDILEEYSNDMKDSPDDSPQPIVEAEKKQEDHGEGIEKCEGKIQEICQLWDNDDEEEEDEEGELVEEEEEDEEEEEEEYDEERYRKKSQEAEEEQEEGLVVDVSWEESSNQKVDNGRGKVVELKLEENGVVKTHKLFASEEYVHVIKSDSQGREFRCFMCYKQFASKILLKTHLVTSHRSNSLCEICLKTFTSANSLKRHMLVHTGVKPYSCDICGRKFSQTSILKRHRFTHGKKKPFECTFCQKSYTQKMNLLTHLRNHGIRTEPVSHRCKVCEKSFVHPSGLSRHLKQHKGVRFCCDSCNKSFSDPSALARHIKSFHC